MAREAVLIVAAAGVLLVSGVRCLPTDNLWPITDEVLANYPFIVVAKTDTATVAEHALVENGVEEWRELRMELLIERVITGNIQPGTYEVLLGPPLEREEDGGHVLRYWYDKAGKLHTIFADDITEPKLWFLIREPSWDASNPKLFLSLATYQGVQPLELEPYFSALQSI